MRALITGAAGFIGSHLSQRLLAEGHEVVGIDNFATGSRENVALLEDHPAGTFIQCDACEPIEVAGRLDWIFHLASPASPPKYLAMPVQTLRVCAEGTRLLLDLAGRSGARFLLASTSEVYGDPLEHPQAESYWGNVNCIGPRSVYDEAKRYAEAMTFAYARSLGANIGVVRIFNTYGPRMDPEDGRVVTNFIVQALRGQPLTVYGDGAQTRSFQYVDDLIEGLVRFAALDHRGPVNLGNPTEYTVLELAHLVRCLAGSRSSIEFKPLPEDDPRQRRPDTCSAGNRRCLSSKG
jgi:dTDP-glucose 4,6-dehydratase